MPGPNPPKTDHIPDHVIDELTEVGTQPQRLKRQDFTLTDGTANQRSKIASYQPDLPLALRDDAPIRLAIVAGEEFTTDGTADNTETFSLANNIVDTPNTTALVLFDDGARVQPDSVDYSADSFDYTDSGTGSTMHAFYVARNPGQIEVEKTAPTSSSGMNEKVFDDVTSILAERNQNKDSLMFEFDGSPLEPVVPARWTIDVYVDVPYAVRWDDDNLTTTNGDTALNAIVSMPVRRAERNIEDLGQAVKRDIIER